MIHLCGYEITITANDPEGVVAGYIESYLQQNFVLVEYEVERQEKALAVYGDVNFPGLK